jgi:hypothetical protein
MLKKTCSVILSAFLFVTVFLLPVVGESSHAASAQNFTDVPSDYWGRSYISFAAEVGIVSGYRLEDGSYQFRPDNSVSKEESMQMLYKAVTNSGIGPAFSQDLPAKYEAQLTEAGIAPWAWECVSYGLENGILEVEELAGFRTDAGNSVPAAREEVARWTGKAINEKLMPATALDYSDRDQIGEENLIYVDLLNRTKIMIGDSTGKFNPKSAIRRVEFAVICNRVYALAEADFDLDSQARSLRGTITGVNKATNNIYLTSEEGSLKVIHLENKIEIVINGNLAYNGLNSVPTGKKAILAWGPFDQLHIATEVVAGEAVVSGLTSVSDDCIEVELRLAIGESVYYYIDGETSVIDEPMEGQDVIFIVDGVKIIEIANKN